jgi:hypothetical protein
MARRLFFQRVPESKVAMNRVHLDIHVEPDRKLAEVETAGEARCTTDRDAQ